MNKINADGTLELTQNEASEAKARFAEMNAYYAKVKHGQIMPIAEILIGMKLTVYIGSDRYVYEVVSKSDKTVVIARDSKQYKVRRDSKNKWRVLRQKFPVCFDHADEYMDPSF